MHADEMEEIDSATAGDIVALFGIDCASGDTFTDGQVRYAMTSMHVPAPVISLAVKPRDKKAEMNMSKALTRFSKEDPTFKVYLDAETSETIICGMGELHLDVYVERMRREYNAEIETGMPKVAYRESPTRRTEFNYTHKKQTGGAGQFGRVAGFMEPLSEGEFEFVNKVTGGAIPTEFIPSCEKGFRACLAKGGFAGFPVVGARVTINDGAAHSVDSSDMAFQQAAIGAFREAYGKLEPGAPRAYHARCGRNPFRVPGRGAGELEPEARNNPVYLGRRRFLDGRGRSAALGDVWLLHRASFLNPGQGRIHHGILPVQCGPKGPGRGNHKKEKENRK